MKLKNKLITLAVIAVLQGCGGGDSSASGEKPDEPEKPMTIAQKIAALEESGQLPKLNRDDTLNGVDADNNGVRDDIDAYIAQQFPAVIQKAATQAAKIEQLKLTVDLNDKDAVRELNNLYSRANGCIFETARGKDLEMKPYFISKKISAITTNTKKRLLAMVDFSHASNGMVFSGQLNGNCDE